ncbi:hypothetical protein OG21DRAFT_1486344 [Imleria badia]|nr:hypothetical protein OG21DRAFT_1486344 [Imleria badia]
MGWLSKIIKRLTLALRTFGALTRDPQVPVISEPSPECADQGQGKEEAPEPVNQSQQYVPPSSGSVTHTGENEETFAKITNDEVGIRAKDVALGLRRLPAGFYTVVQHSGREWRTENKGSSVDDDVVEWAEPIPIPSDISTTVYIKVYASFEFQPMLGAGEQLREISITVEQLLDHSAKDVPFTFLLKDGDVVSPCSSVLIIVERRTCENCDSSALRELGPHYSTAESVGKLEETTNQGHAALSRYRRDGGKRDLERSIEEFERALSVCALDDPCRAAAQSNLAMAKFIHCQVENTDTSLEVPLRLYRNALAARPVGHVDRPSTLIHLAAAHFAQIAKQRDEVEGRHVEALLLEAMELSSTESHEIRAATFMLQMHAKRAVDPIQADDESSAEEGSAPSLTNEDPWISSLQFLQRFEEFEDLADLQLAITFLEEFVRSSSVGDDRYRKGLANLGMALQDRFKHLREPSDIENAISRIRDAVDLTPHDHPDKSNLLDKLGMYFGFRFDHLGELSDIEYALSTLRDAVDLTPRGHPEKPCRLNNLGTCFLARFHRLGELSDIEHAISTLRDAVDLTPHDHPHNHLHPLVASYRLRFERLGELSDLEHAISTLRIAIDLTPHGHPQKPGHLHQLGVFYTIRLQHLGELSDLEDAISMFRNAVELTPHGHPDKPSRLHNLGASFKSRFQRLGEPSDLGHAISMFRDAVDLTPHGHPDKPDYLDRLGTSFSVRYERLGELSDLEDAISMLRDAVDLTPHGHSDKPSRLHKLGSSFRDRFERLREPSDLGRAILMFRDAVNLTPRGHPDKLGYLHQLGMSFAIRFQRLGELSDVEDAISMFRDTVDLTPHSHPNKPGHLKNLGVSFIYRFQRLGEPSDLGHAISMFRDAVDLTPHGHPDKPGYLDSLSTSFSDRFERLGELSDLDNAISTRRDAVDLTPRVHPDKPSRLHNLGASLAHRFQRLGKPSDIEDAISMFGDAIDLTPNGHPDKPLYLGNLGTSFVLRLERLGELSDLERAMSTFGDAVNLVTDEHPHKREIVKNSGLCVFARFHHSGKLSDLDHAISIFEYAVDLTPYGHPDKHSCLNNLGNSFRVRFNQLRELSDLERAISTLRDAVALTPHGHSNKACRLENLGISYQDRFKCLGELSDLERAISTLRDAVDLTPHDHPHRPTHLNSLATSSFTRFERLGELSDLERAISLYSHAASDRNGPVEARVDASQKWISCARRIRHHSLLHAYSIAISLLPELAWIGLPITHRYGKLKRGADVVREAAAAALDSGLPETAVEWLEQGRSIVWGELFQLRSSYEELSSAHPDHALKLRELSAALEQAGSIHEKYMSALFEQNESAADRITEPRHQEIDRHRGLAIERDKLLEEIRGFPGFEQFLLCKQFSQLRASAHSGPVVILNAAESRCDALIVLADVDHVIHVPLPNLPYKRSTGFQNMLERLLGHDRGVLCDDRKGDPSTRGVSWESLLSVLWHDVVKPVLNALAFSTPGDLSRIFWCPTGPFTFLPIHAAGLYGTQHSQPGHKVLDFVVSSYVPTLSVLAVSPNPSVPPSGDLRLLVVGQPPSDGLPRLQGVDIELGYIKALIRNSASACTTLLESSVGTVEEILPLIKEADWVHFACHGIQDTEVGTESGLCLANGRRLKLRDIIAVSRPRGGLAFLSACQTAMGDEGLSDEAIHIAAGMLFAGYGGVIGTMWSISDKLAPDVARDVYAQLFRNDTRPDYRDAARALHEAIGRVQETVPFHIWLPFIHGPLIMTTVDIYLPIESTTEWIRALSIPHEDIKRFTLRPLKWLRFATFAVCGAKGDFSATQGGERVDHENVSFDNLADKYYYIPDDVYHLVDYNVFNDRCTSSVVTTGPADFSRDILGRDGSCVITRDIDSCDAVHIIPKSKGSNYISFVVHDRSSLYEELPFSPEDYIDMDCIENGILLRGGIHKKFGKAQLVFLKTPNFAMVPADVPWLEPGSIPDNRTTLQYIEQPTGRATVPQYDVQADWRDEVRPPPSILLDFVYGAAVVKRWKCDGLRDMLEQRFKDDFKKILDETPKRSTPEDDEPQAGVEPDDPNDCQQRGRKTFSSDASAGLLEAMDDVIILSMLLKGTTPRSMAAEWKRRNEKEELRSQEHSREKHSQVGYKVPDFVVSSYVPTLSVLGVSPNLNAAPSADLRPLAVRQPPSDGLPPLPGVDAELELIKAVNKNSPSACTLVESSVGTVEEALSLMKEADWTAMGEERLSDEAIHIAAGMLFAGYGGVIGTM